jgi:putative restriction endonuclease
MTPGLDNDASIRVAVFQRVRALEARFGGAIPWRAIQIGFDFQGENVLLANRARGVFRPRQMARGVLSVKTTVPREGRERRYDDIAAEDWLL